MADFHAQRTAHEYRHQVHAPPERIFPLLCPVLEYEWLESWRCEMIYSRSGVAELGCIFTTDFPGEGHAVWTVSRYEPNRRIEFVVNSETQVTHLAIELEASEHGTGLYWKRTFTGLNEQGNAFVQRLSGGFFDTRMQYIVRALGHYLQTGEMLHGAAPQP